MEENKINKKRNYAIGIIVLFLIVAISFFLRFWRLRDYIMFLGDQGRDVLVVKKILLDGKFTLLGPVASVGGFYLGPLYYYLIAPFLLLFNFDPIGPAFFVAGVTSLTPFLLFFYLKTRYSTKIALLASFLFAVSPTLVRSSRYSWNPNLVPLFSFLFYVFFENFLETKKIKYGILTGILLGCLFQLHYLAFVFIPVTILMLAVNAKSIKNFIVSTAAIIFGVILGWLPFIIYEFRHSWQNFSGLIEFISRSDGTNVGFDSTRYLKTIYTNFKEIFFYLFNLPQAAIIILFIVFLLYFWQKRKSILVQFVALSLLILSLYKGRMGEHYFNILYVFFLIVFADFFSLLLKKSMVFLGVSGIIFLSYFCVMAYPFWKEPNRQLDQTIEISRYVLAKYAKNKPFNFALITSTNSDFAYRYFFDLWGNPPKEILNDVIDPKRESVTKKLIVLCEPLAPCVDPRGHSLWEIAAFGRAEIARKENHGVYTIYEMERTDIIGKAKK